MRILNSNEVVKKIGLSKVTVWRMERAGLFPKRINLSDRRVGWMFLHDHSLQKVFRE